MIFFAMWFPDQTLQNSILAGLSLCHRQPPFIGPYLQCTFAMQHQFVCDTIATTTSLSSLVLHQLEQEDRGPDYEKHLKHKKLSSRHHSIQSQLPSADHELTTTSTSSCPASGGSSWLLLLLAAVLFRWPCTKVPKSVCHVLGQASRCLTHPYLLLTYLTFVAYWPALWAELVFDDRPAIIENKDLRWHSSWSQLWSNDYWGTPLKSPLSHKSYRPLTVITFRLNYLFHQLQPFGYHLVNLILHSLVSILFYRFCVLFLNESTETSKPKVTKLATTQHVNCVSSTGTVAPKSAPANSPLHSTSFVISLIFCAHPIHTECVSSVVGRAELLSAFFYLAAILVWTTSKSETTDSRNASQLQLLLDQKWKLIAIPLALLGFLCKEQSILALVYLCLFELNRIKLGTRPINNATTDRRSLFRACWMPLRRKNASAGRSLVLLLLLLVSLFVVIYLRFAIMHHTLPTFSRFDNPAARAAFPTRHLTYAFLAVYHFWLLLVPLRLSCDWTHASIELIDFSDRHLSLDLFRALCSLLVLAGLGLFLLRLVYMTLAPGRLPFLCRLRSVNGHKMNDNSQKTLHALALTLIPFVPASNLFFSTGFTIAERVMYLPSIGFLLLLAIGVRHLTMSWSAKERHAHHLVHLMLIVLVAVFCMRTYSRSLDWSNEYHLYKSGLEVNPTNTKLMNNLGRLYEKDRQIDDAIQLYEKAIEIEPADIRSHLNLGNALMVNNNLKSAENVYREALSQVEQELFAQTDPSEHFARNPTLSPLYLTALVRLAELINYDSSRVNLEHDLEQIRQKMTTLHSMMTSNGKSMSFDGRTHLPPSCGLHCQSTQFTDRSIELNHLYNMAVLHYRQGQSKQALEYFEQVLALDPRHKDALLASAQIIEKENIEQLSNVALDRLNRLVQLGKDDATVYFSLAMFAAKANKHDQARQLFHQAIDRQPSFAEAHYNLALLLVKELEFLDRHHHKAKRHSNIHLALIHLKKVLTINHKHVKSMLVLGDLFAEELQQVDTARRYYQLVIERVQPNHHQARHNLCVLWHKQNNLDQAIKCFKVLRQDLMRDLEHIATIGQIEKQLEVLLEARRSQWSTPRPQSKLFKLPTNHFCANVSSQATGEKLVNLKNCCYRDQHLLSHLHAAHKDNLCHSSSLPRCA